ncbi:elongation factor 1-alpha C-terminal domain-related protein, partial [Methyloterricola oryzae]|uniref:elongation factor 1-alpha C-terminal domain-related protein n=1 Tax=Methyloterricola oryzae TaxID=1495050 RepID=UPI0005EB8AA5
FRGFSGTLAAGVLKPGDTVMALPSRKTSRVKAIVTQDGDLEEAFPPQAITVTLEDEIDVSRGDMLVTPEDEPTVASRFMAHVVWMAEAALSPGRQYYIKQTTKTVSGSVARIAHRIDVNTLEHHPAQQLKLNEIGLCEVALSAPIAFDPYALCKGTGSFIVIDRLTHVTVGAGMIVGAAEDPHEVRKVTPAERAARFAQNPAVIWLTGTGAEEAAYRLERRLFDLGHASVVLEDLGVEASGDLAQHFNHAGLICLCPLAQGEAPEGAWHVAIAAQTFDPDNALDLLREKGILL